MEKTPFIVHDLKTDRAGISGGLPSAYRLVPIAFYVCLVAALALNVIFYLSFRSHKAAEQRWSLVMTESQLQQTDLIGQQKTLLSEARRAEEIANWVEGARAVQPITVSVARSMGADATIASLNLTRNPEMPAHLFMSLKLNGTDASQLESTLDAITGLNYQTYSAQQTKGEDAVDFDATLIWNNAR